MKNGVSRSSAHPANLIDGLGARLRTLRKERRMTVKDLADNSGVSIGMISQIERNLSSPSIRVLERIRQAMNIPLMALLEGAENTSGVEDQIVRRKKDRPVLVRNGGAIIKQLLSPAGDHDVQFMYITMKPGAVQRDVLISSGEKAGVILSGSIVLQVNGKLFRLNEEDSFQFSSNTTHFVENDSENSATILWIMNTKAVI